LNESSRSVYYSNISACRAAKISNGEFYLKIGILLITGLLFININPISEVNAQLESGITHATEDVKDPANNIPGKAVVLIYSNAKWSGNIMDSSFDSSTIDGIGYHREVIDCSGTLPIYSLAIQKQVEYGYILVGVVKGGILLDMGDTTADYGIVSLSGQCP
jgi:hypothetical protein